MSFEARIIMIGEAPGRFHKPGAAPLSGYARKLETLASLEEGSFARFFTTTNLLSYYPGEGAGKGSAFPQEEAKKAAEACLVLFRHRKVLLAGKRVARAFGLSLPYFKWIDFAEGRTAVIPHPSGVNRWYNERRNREKMGRFIFGLCQRRKPDESQAL